MCVYVQISSPDTMFVMREYKEINKTKILNINKVDVLMSPLLGLQTKATPNYAYT